MRFTYYFWYTLSKLAAKSCFQYEVRNRHYMIEEGSALLASNHTSYLDPPLVGICSKRDVYFLARKSLLNSPVMAWLLPRLNVIPVDLLKNDISALKALIRVVRSGNAAVVFPEGTRSVDGKLQPARPGTGMIIAHTLAPVIPVRIFGAQEAFPKGGKVHLSPITVVLGPPIYFTKADIGEGGKDAYQRISQRVMDAIAQITLDS
ncbi:MAG: lysophospholipid acyltransferase family protein [Chthoniobacterales bacterium]